MQKQKVCPKCKGIMILGNYTGHQVNWDSEDGHKFLQSSGRKIATYACEKCGYLESYAQ